MLCCFSNKGELFDRINNRKVKIFVMNYGQGLHLKSIIRLASLFKKNSVDIVHTHGWGSRSLVSLLASKLAHVPVCINGEHGLLHTESYLALTVQKLIAPMFDGTLSVSESLKKKLVRKIKISPEKINVIPNGVDTKKFHGNYDTKKLRIALSIKQEDFVVGVIGTLKPKKNQKVVLHALSKIKTLDSNIQLIIIGDGPCKAFLIELSNELGIANKVHFLGYRNDIPEILSMIDILVLPSVKDHEGMSNVILEAMASKVAVISSRSVGSDELIENEITGLLFDHQDSEELVRKIKAIIHKKDLRKKIIDNALHKVLYNHNLEEIVKLYEDYYLKKISEKK
jgi:glycosyltransferase involved in cell wall biosynthesis